MLGEVGFCQNLEMVRIQFGSASFDLVWLISLFEKKKTGQIEAGKEKCWKNLARKKKPTRKRPGGEKKVAKRLIMEKYVEETGVETTDAEKTKHICTYA